MWATVELNDEIIKFVKDVRLHTETFDEIKELVFTKERLSKECNILDMMNLTLQFQDIKNSALSKIEKQKQLNFPEGFVVERLMSKYFNNELIPVEEHIKQIKASSSNRKERRKNDSIFTKLYDSFIKSICNKERNSNEK